MRSTVLWSLAMSVAACGGDAKVDKTLKELEGTWQAPCLANAPDANGL